MSKFIEKVKQKRENFNKQTERYLQGLSPRIRLYIVLAVMIFYLVFALLFLLRSFTAPQGDGTWSFGKMDPPEIIRQSPTATQSAANEKNSNHSSH